MFETVVIIFVVGAIAHWAHRVGKREGSKKGYNVGRRNRRRRR